MNNNTKYAYGRCHESEFNYNEVRGIEELLMSWIK